VLEDMKRSKAGAMEALTVIVLAVAAIVLAAFVWIFLLGSTQTQTAAPDFVFDASLISMNPGSCRLSVTVRNTGNVPLDRADVFVSGAAVFSTATVPAIRTSGSRDPLIRNASTADRTPEIRKTSGVTGSTPQRPSLPP
jgi:hypothetical protein